MAIHVRPRRSQIATINRRNRQRSIIAVCAASTTLLFLGLTLFFVRFLILQDTPPSFIAYTPNDTQTIDSKAPTIKELTSSGASPNSSVMPTIIVSTGPSAVVMEPMNFSLDGTGLGSDAFDGLGMGIGLAGGGIGSGTGNGVGDGHGRGNGGGSGKKGLNDDIQVVLVLDASGSMDQLFTIVSDALHEFLVTLNHCTLNGKPAKVNVGIVCYGQAKDNGAPQIISNFSKDVETMRAKLKEVACDGALENCGQAIDFSVEKFPWNLRDRDDMLKIIFIAGNEEFEQGPVDYRTAMRHARQRNIIVNTIYCGGEDEQWKQAAREGRGEGFSISMQTGGNDEERGSEEQQLAMARELCEVPLIPCGSPQERARRSGELSKLTPRPNKKNLPKWVQVEGRALVQGFDWDAVEICRRAGADFTLAMVGGLPNLPKELRHQGEENALEHLKRAAERRQQALDNYNQALFGNNEFCTKALDVIRRQAADKGIDMQI